MKRLLLIIFSVIHITSAAQTAGFGVNSAFGCAPLQVQFQNQSIGATSYHWSFGDGNFSTLANPTNLYNQAGSYTVRLIAFSLNSSDTLVLNNLIQVDENPIANYQIVNANTCLLTHPVQFVNNGDTSNTYTWIFGVGDTVYGSNASHT